MFIRPAKPEDARAIATYISMAESEMLVALFGADDTEQVIAILEQYILAPEPSRYCLAVNTVAEEDGAAAGSIIAFPADSQPELDKPLLAALRARGIDLNELTREGAPGTWYASTMGVHPGYRGRGFASTLLRAAVRTGRESGYDTTSLLVARAKTKVRGLYERLGFQALDEVRIVDVVYDRMIVRADAIL